MSARGLQRVDGVAKLNGTEKLMARTMHPADALWLRVIRSPHARAQLHAGRRRGLSRPHGLDLVMTADDVPDNGFGIYPTIKDQPVLAKGHVRYRGDAVIGIGRPARRGGMR